MPAISLNQKLILSPVLFNVKKTKVMTTAGNGKINIILGGEEIECVDDFTFQGS